MNRISVNGFAAASVCPVIIACAENTFDRVNPFSAHRIERMRLLIQCFMPDCKIILLPENRDIRSVRTDLSCRQIIKRKDIFDDLVFGCINRSLFSAGIGHHEDFLLCDGIIFFVRINTEQPQNCVCGNIQKPDKRRKYRLHNADHFRHVQCKALCIFHPDALRHQFTKHKR